MDRIPEFVSRTLEILWTGGYPSYLVGGCLRDMLLARPIHDWDVATAAPASAVSALFPKTVETGVRYGTVTVVTEEGHIEVTTFRSDGVYSDGRRPDSVTFTNSLTEDLQRRDFTINAMAMGLDGAVIDPFDGQGDLGRRLIRCVGNAGERFSEDALRMFRALRFAAQLSFKIDDDTYAAIRSCAPLCAALSAERMRDETEKILLSAQPERAAEAVSLGLYAGRLLNASLPEHPGRIAGLPPSAMLRWAAFGASLQASGAINDPGRFCGDMRLDAKTVKACDAGIRAALKKPLPADKTGLKRLLADIGTEAARCAAAADTVLRGGDTVARIEAVMGSGECYSIKELAVTGEDLIRLGFTPGAKLGAALRKLLDHVIEHPSDNNREVLLKLADMAIMTG